MVMSKGYPGQNYTDGGISTPKSAKFFLSSLVANAKFAKMF
jgi:hypothetical protein